MSLSKLLFQGEWFVCGHLVPADELGEEEVLPGVRLGVRGGHAGAAAGVLLQRHRRQHLQLKYWTIFMALLLMKK